jgi:hypothetical protein
MEELGCLNLCGTLGRCLRHPHWEPLTYVIEKSLNDRIINLWIMMLNYVRVELLIETSQA